MAEGFPKLEVMAGPEEGDVFTLAQDEASRIGRNSDNAVTLEDSSVSRRHAVVVPKDGRFVLQDLESHNGTICENKKLSEGEERILNHLDVITLGIYELRYLDKPFQEEDWQRKQAERDAAQKVAEKSVETGEIESTDQPSQEASQEEESLPENIEEAESFLDDILDEQEGLEEIIEEKQKQKWRERIWVLILWVSLLVLLGVFLYGYFHGWFFKENPDAGSSSFQIQPVKKADVASVSPDKKDVPPKEDSSFTVVPKKDEKDPDQKALQTVFLDVRTQPMPATVYFKGKRLGLAPFRTAIDVKAGESYKLDVDFELRDLNDIYRKTVSFQAKEGSDVIEIKVQAEIGILKIARLPRRSEFYLEGYYDYDKLRANPVRLKDIVYGKPIYLPYGKYRVELREEESVSQSTNRISMIKYQREHVLNEKSPLLVLKVTDQDLKKFPVSIKTDPTYAKVYYNDEYLGRTPYKGTLPIGEGQLKVDKEGYFEKVIPVDMRMNSIYEVQVKLDTSEAGEKIQKAKVFLKNTSFKEGIDVLVEALKLSRSPKERAEVYFLLAEAYVGLKDYDRALPYYEKAQKNKDFQIRATLGAARIYRVKKRHNDAVSAIVEVMVSIDKSTPANIRAEANSVFKKISPFKSIIFVYTDPPGANVFVNEKRIQGETPLILSDLGLATYRIEIEKPGYETYKTKQSLKLSEFVLLKVKLVEERF